MFEDWYRRIEEEFSTRAAPEPRYYVPCSNCERKLRVPRPVLARKALGPGLNFPEDAYYFPPLWCRFCDVYTPHPGYPGLDVAAS